MARKPNDGEVDVIEQLYVSELQRIESQQMAEKLIGRFKDQYSQPKPTNLQEWAVWFCVTNALLNLDETITKN